MRTANQEQMNNYTVEANSRNVLTVRFSDISAGWGQWVLLSADRHHDSIHCDRKLELYHLEQAQERGALIIDCGDLFDAMQGKWDPRSSMDDLRPELRTEAYLDEAVKLAAQDYAPFAHHFLMIGYGNHETKIRNRHGTDLISNLVHRLNTEHDGNVFLGAYGGWVRFMFQVNGTKRSTKRLKYHHGAGGGGPVTRGVIQSNRQAVYLPDADFVVNGHTHDSWHVPIARERLSIQGVVRRDLVHFIRTPGYKDEYGDGGSGFHNERWAPPKPIGAVWLRFFVEDSTNGVIGEEVLQAVK